MSNFFKEMISDIFKKLIKLSLLFVVLEAGLLISYYCISQFYDEASIEKEIKVFANKINHVLDIETSEKRKLLAEQSACVSEQAFPYYLIGSTMGASVGYLSCRCWQGLKEGLRYGAIRGSVVGIYVDMIACEIKK